MNCKKTKSTEKYSQYLLWFSSHEATMVAKLRNYVLSQKEEDSNSVSRDNSPAISQRPSDSCCVA